MLIAGGLFLKICQIILRLFQISLVEIFLCQPFWLVDNSSFWLNIKAREEMAIQRENSKRIIQRIRFIARKKSWNQGIAAYNSDIEDFEIDEETRLDSESNLKSNEYNTEKIQQIQQISSTSMNWIILINI